jgi:acyl dehydratase
MANTYESIQVGDSFEMKRLITAQDVQTFADITGDDNPIHVDPEYAKTHSRFGKPIVHGVLLLGLISKVLGRDYPGHGSVAASLSCRFLRPVPVGSEVDVKIKVSQKMESRRTIKVRVSVHLDGKMVLGGDGTVIPPTGEEEEAPVIGERMRRQEG